MPELIHLILVRGLENVAIEQIGKVVSDALGANEVKVFLYQKEEPITKKYKVKNGTWRIRDQPNISGRIKGYTEINKIYVGIPQNGWLRINLDTYISLTGLVEVE